MSIPDTMQAIEISGNGESAVLAPCVRPVPPIGANDVLIRVHAAGVNRPDILQRKGKYAPPAGISDIPGLEVAGTIVACGANVDGFTAGEYVAALVAGGGYAEYCAAPAGQCLPYVPGWTDAEMAAMPETFFTVWKNLFDIGKCEEDSKILLHGGTSGIGTTAIQLAKAFGAQIAVTCGSNDKCFAAAALGADMAINYNDRAFEDVLKARDFAPDIVIDMVGGDYIDRNISVMAEGGIHISIASQAGAIAPLTVFHMMRKQVTLTGSTLRPRPVAEKQHIRDTLVDRVYPHFKSGRIKPVIHAHYALADAESAHQDMMAGDHIGKLVLDVSA